MKTNMKNRALAMTAAALLLLGSLSACAPGNGQTAPENEEKPIEVGAHAATLLAGGGFEVKSGIEPMSALFGVLTANVGDAGVKKADAAVMLGGYSHVDISITNLEVDRSYKYLSDPEDVEAAIAKIRDDLGVFGLAKEQMLFAQGDRDTREDASSLAESGAYDAADGTYGLFLINESDYGWSGTQESGDHATLARITALLERYLAKKLDEGYQGPVFIGSHVPLSRCYMDNEAADKRLGSTAYLLDVLNDAGARGLNLFYLFGAARYYECGTYLDSLYDTCLRGEKMPVLDDSKNETWLQLNFNYCNVGYSGLHSPLLASVDAALGLCVLDVYENAVTLTRYGAYATRCSAGDEVLYTTEDGRDYGAATDAPSETVTIPLVTPMLKGFNLAGIAGITRSYGTNLSDYSVRVSGKNPVTVDFSQYLDASWTLQADNEEIATVDGLSLALSGSGTVTATLSKDGFSIPFTFAVSKTNASQAKAKDYVKALDPSWLEDGMHCIFAFGSTVAVPAVKDGGDSLDTKSYTVDGEVASIPFPELEWTLRQDGDGFRFVCDAGELSVTGEGNATTLTLSPAGDVFTVSQLDGALALATAKGPVSVYGGRLSVGITSQALELYLALPF